MPRLCYRLVRMARRLSEVEPTVAPEAEPARERDDALWQQDFSILVEGSRHGTYRPAGGAS
jgi:hypothetical protein